MFRFAHWSLGVALVCVGCSGRVSPSVDAAVTADTADSQGTVSADVAAEDVATLDVDKADVGPEDMAEVAGNDTTGDTGLIAPSNGTDGKGASVQVLSRLSIAAKSQSCDLNGDGKPDNGFAGAASLIGTQLQDAVNQGKLIALLDPATFDATGKPWTYSVWMGGNMTTGACVPGQCAYQIAQENFTGVNCGGTKLCFSQAKFVAKAQNGQMTATSPGVDMIMPFSGSYVGLSMINLTVKGPIAAQGGQWLGSSQVLVCGTMTAIHATFDTSSLVKPDIDTNGDGVPDGVSFAFLYDTVTATTSL